MKVSKSEKIRNLLKQGMTVNEVAKKLKISPAYVYSVRWQAKQKAAKKSGKKAKTNGNGHAAAPVQAELIPMTLDEKINKLSEQLSVLVDARLILNS